MFLKTSSGPLVSNGDQTWLEPSGGPESSQPLRPKRWEFGDELSISPRLSHILQDDPSQMWDDGQIFIGRIWVKEGSGQNVGVSIPLEANPGIAGILTEETSASGHLTDVPKMSQEKV